MDKQLFCCRRTNYVHASYVSAAVRIHRAMGSDRAYWMLIREGVAASVIQRVLRADDNALRQPNREPSGRMPLLVGRHHAALVGNRRADGLMARRVDVGLVFQLMLGTEAAAQYLRDARVPAWIAARVLGSALRRPSGEPVST
jgi:hypothetical protein